MKNPLIIKGAVYSNGDRLLVPHYTGNFYLVDCREYLTEEDMRGSYDESFVDEALEGAYLTMDGVKYYECENNAKDTADMELLSDLSDLEFNNEETEF